MCTLIVATRVWPEAPLVVAANRDEALDRASAPPSRWHPGVTAPRDLVAGGTWLGLSDNGLFCALTNRHAGKPDPERRSRGELVLKALDAGNVASAAAAIAALNPADYNPFHLVVTSPESAALVWHAGDHLVRDDWTPGVYIVTERSFGAADSGRETALAGHAAALAGASLPAADALASILQSHGEPPFDGICVHVPEWSYGTRSSTILYLGPDGQPLHWLSTEGPPCRSGYRNVV